MTVEGVRDFGALEEVRVEGEAEIGFERGTLGLLGLWGCEGDEDY
jgi:hypothetical protein